MRRPLQAAAEKLPWSDLFVHNDGSHIVSKLRDDCSATVRVKFGVATQHPQPWEMIVTIPKSATAERIERFMTHDCPWPHATPGRLPERIHFLLVGEPPPAFFYPRAMCSNILVVGEHVDAHVYARRPAAPAQWIVRCIVIHIRRDVAIVYGHGNRERRCQPKVIDQRRKNGSTTRKVLPLFLSKDVLTAETHYRVERVEVGPVEAMRLRAFRFP